tara:strand:- start:224 stop:1801 length:1578 start_codon:yes stop_codon:yes gene_type:complete
MGTYTPSSTSTTGPRKPWPIDKPLCRLEIAQTIPEPIKYEEDNTIYAIPATQSLATTDIGTGWIESGRSYLLFVTVRYQLADLNDDLQITVLERSTGSNVVLDGSLMKHVDRKSPPDADHFMTYNFVTKFTASSTSTNGPIVFLEHLAGNTQATQEYAQMILFDLTNLNEGNDYFFEENTTNSTNSTSAVERESATLNLTKDNKGAWLLGTALQYKCNNADNFNAITIISDAESNVLGGETVFLDATKNNEENVLNFLTVINNDLSDTAWNVKVYSNDESAPAARSGNSYNTTQHSKVWGIRLDRFVSTTFTSNVSVNTSTANDTKVVAAELTSVPVKYSSPKFLVFQGGVGNLPDSGAYRRKQRFFTDVQWKVSGGTYARFGDDDQQNTSTLRWKGDSPSVSPDYDNNLSWFSTVPPASLSSITKGTTLSFKLDVWKTDIDEDAEGAVELTDVFLAVVELPPNLGKASESDANYSLKANHSTHIIGPTTLQNCLDVRNKMLESRGFATPKRWDTVWTKEDITLR